MEKELIGWFFILLGIHILGSTLYALLALYSGLWNVALVLLNYLILFVITLPFFFLIRAQEFSGTTKTIECIIAGIASWFLMIVIVLIIYLMPLLSVAFFIALMVLIIIGAIILKKLGL